MKIGLDLDGVVFDLMTEWLKNYNETYDDHVTKDQIRGYSIDQYFTKCSKEIVFGPTMLNYDAMLECKFFLGAKEKVIEFATDHELTFVTATFMHNRTTRTKRLSQEFGDFKWDLIYSADKSKYEFDVFIDDSFEQCSTYKYINPKTKVVMITRPWNEDREFYQRIPELKYLNLEELF